MKRILILAHRHQSFEGRTYYLVEIARVWREKGLEVVVAHGPENCVDADLAVLHVDLTVVPDEYLAALRRYPRVVNGATADISKRRISRLRLQDGGAYDGPVIVKSNWNMRGQPEWSLASRGLLPERFRIRPAAYELYQSPAEVPAGAWNDPDRIVERFEPEVEDGLFRLRMWKFFGDRETTTIASSREPIVKGANVIRREETSEVPDELRRLRRELGFDFGKFDYGLVDGRVMLYDANRTPVYSRPLEEETPRIRSFAEGLGGFA